MILISKRGAGLNPEMNRFTAILLKLIKVYQCAGYGLFINNLQHMGYLINEISDREMRFNKAEAGPYAKKLNQWLKRIEGHFIRGYGDRSKDAQIYLMPDAVAQADQFLASDADAAARLAQVKALIEGFETPYGMELLASVHWVSQYDEAKNMDAAVEQLHGWNERKAKLMQAKHIQKAFERLNAQGWL